MQKEIKAMYSEVSLLQQKNDTILLFLVRLNQMFSKQFSLQLLQNITIQCLHCMDVLNITTCVKENV